MDMFAKCVSIYLTRILVFIFVFMNKPVMWNSFDLFCVVINSS